MEFPLQITFRGMDQSDAATSMIRERAERLERFHHRIISCHVVVDMPHRHQSTGREFAVRIDITTPTGEIAVTHDHGRNGKHEELGIVVRDAFDAATRQLEDETRRRRGDVKTHGDREL